MFEVIHYTDAGGNSLIDVWLMELRDQRARARIAARIDRLEQGLFGDRKPVKGGVGELLIDYGPGYRVYYSLKGKRVVLLLCGGDKRIQKTDIKEAKARLKEWDQRK